MEILPSTVAMFVHVGTHYTDLLTDLPSHRPITSPDDLRKAIAIAHQTTAARFDEHFRNRPKYKISRGRAYEAYTVWQARNLEAYTVWQARLNLLQDACQDLASLLLLSRNHPAELFKAYALWADPKPSR